MSGARNIELQVDQLSSNGSSSQPNWPQARSTSSAPIVEEVQTEDDSVDERGRGRQRRFWRRLRGWPPTDRRSTSWGVMKRIVSFPFRIRRLSADVTLTPAPPFQIHPLKALSGLKWFLRLEGTEAAVLFVISTFLLFTALKLPLSEFRERVTGWLTFFVIVTSIRCIFVTMLLEQVKWLQSVQTRHDIRGNLVSLMTSTRMCASRWFQILAVLWWLFAWQVLAFHAQYRQTIEIWDKAHPNGPPIRVSPIGGFKSYPPKPLLTFSVAETEMVEIIHFVARVGLIMLVPYTVALLATVLFYFYRRNLTYMCWLALLTPDGLQVLPPTADAPPLPVSPDVLATFPIFQWRSEWSQPSDLQQSAERVDRCTICLCDFEPGNLVRLLPCAHVFHRACIDEWLGAHSTCPLRCSALLTSGFNGDFGDAALSERLPIGMHVELAQLYPERVKSPTSLSMAREQDLQAPTSCTISCSVETHHTHTLSSCTTGDDFQLAPKR